MKDPESAFLSALSCLFGLLSSVLVRACALPRPPDSLDGRQRVSCRGAVTLCPLHLPLASVARMKTLYLPCGAPVSAARKPYHCASYPMSARSPSTRPTARRVTFDLFPINPGRCSRSLSLWAVALSSPLTFSMTAYCGLMVSIAVRIAPHRFDRVPSVMPALRPASDTSWQGNPPVMMSTGSTADQSTCVTSRKFGTPGQCFASTFDGASSHSACQTVSA